MERVTWEASSLIRMRMDVQRALDEICDAHHAPPLVRVPSTAEMSANAATSASSSCADVVGLLNGAKRVDALSDTCATPTLEGELARCVGAGLRPSEGGVVCNGTVGRSSQVAKRARASPARRQAGIDS